MNDFYKNLWTINDYQKMLWHDVTVYGFSFNPNNYEIIFDIDYIFKWILTEEKIYKFSIAPATLVFENAYDIRLDIITNGSIIIDKLLKKNKRKPKNANFVKGDCEWDWIIETNQGEISLKSTGFKLFVKGESVLSENQNLDRYDKCNFFR